MFSMDAENVGTWMYHCHVFDHIKAGMTTEYTILSKDGEKAGSGHMDMNDPHEAR